MDKEYISALENVIKQMLVPLKGIPFGLVIESISGKKVIPFDKFDLLDSKLLGQLIEAANLAGMIINKTGIYSSRANEVGNAIEPFVIDGLNRIGLIARKPQTEAGKERSAGYPDIYFIDNFRRSNYLECKTYNKKSLESSLRSFYLSPSTDFKIIYDAHHFVLSYEIVEQKRSGAMNLYRCSSWKLLSIEKLLVNVKYEFNADNKELYKEELILAEGEITL